MISWQSAREKLHQRQEAAAKATAIPVQPTQTAQPTTPTASTAPATSGEATRKKHRAQHVGKRKRRY
ncbi:MAG: hypothetical protein RMJ83_10520, partial [Armatimonadota bacterium]|nr:hypothetical protein [Armatimonadota bacterium]